MNEFIKITWTTSMSRTFWRCKFVGLVDTSPGLVTIAVAFVLLLVAETTEARSIAAIVLVLVNKVPLNELLLGSVVLILCNEVGFINKAFVVLVDGLSSLE